jgi:hypothetical protein
VTCRLGPYRRGTATAALPVYQRANWSVHRYRPILLGAVKTLEQVLVAVF